MFLPTARSSRDSEEVALNSLRYALLGSLGVPALLSGCGRTHTVEQEGAAVSIAPRPDWTARIASLDPETGDLLVSGVTRVDDPSFARNQAALDGAAIAATVIQAAAQRLSRTQQSSTGGAASTTDANEERQLQVSVVLQELIPGPVYYDRLNRATYVLSRMPKAAYLAHLRQYQSAAAEDAVRASARETLNRP